MYQNILEAVNDGDWDFEPPEARPDEFDSTPAIPGTREKLQVISDRVRAGLPLFHPHDRPYTYVLDPDLD